MSDPFRVARYIYYSAGHKHKHGPLSFAKYLVQDQLKQKTKLILRRIVGDAGGEIDNFQLSLEMVFNNGSAAS